MIGIKISGGCFFTTLSFKVIIFGRIFKGWGFPVLGYTREILANTRTGVIFCALKSNDS
jgi:hypothetical protein